MFLSMVYLKHSYFLYDFHLCIIHSPMERSSELNHFPQQFISSEVKYNESPPRMNNGAQKLPLIYSGTEGASE